MRVGREAEGRDPHRRRLLRQSGARRLGRHFAVGQHRKELKGGEELTTNNRMELMAAISALEALKSPSDVDLYTDSNYLRGGITSWIKGWKRNGWRTADKKPVRNIELWQRLEQAAEPHHVRWHWVKGHHGHDENERADELAREGMAPFLKHRKRTEED